MSTPLMPRSRIEGQVHRSFAMQVTKRAVSSEAMGSDESADQALLSDNLILEISFASEYPYLRADSCWDAPWVETPGLADGECDLSILNSGAPVLLNHGRDKTEDSALRTIGRTQRAWINGGRAYAEIKLSRRDDMEGIIQDIQDGIVADVSVGYAILERTLIKQTEGMPDEYRLTNWQPREITICDMPVDPTIGIGRSVDPSQQPARYKVIDLPSDGKPTTNFQEHNMKHDYQAIKTLAAQRGITPFVDGMIAAGADPELINRSILEKMAEQSDSVVVRSGYQHDATLENPGFRAQLMAEGLASRLSGPAPSEAAKQFANMSLLDMGRQLLELRGTRTAQLSANELMTRALTNSDLPAVLGGVGERKMRQAYATYQGGLKRIAKPSTSPDFRAKSRIQLSEAPKLEKVNEHGEFKQGALGDAAESYAVGTYGKIIGLSRQALVNDQLGAFADLANRFGRAASEFEAGFLVNLVTSNPVMSDSVALFHATHGNLAGTPAALSVASLGLARKAMRLQKGLDGTTPIDATPRYLVVPAALETVAEQLLASLTPHAVADVNPFSNKLELVVDPRLDAISVTAWYIAADQNMLDGLEYSYLEGQAGPYIETRIGFSMDGIEMKCRLDFGAGILDYRGLFKNAGV